MIVVDTNVIGYLVMREETLSSAEATYQKDLDWSAPRLWRSELRSVLWQAVRHKKIDLPLAKSLFGEAERLVLGREHEVNVGRVLELACQSGCSTYDCEFVSLAEALSVPLVTADRKLLAAFPSMAISMDDFLAL